MKTLLDPVFSGLLRSHLITLSILVVIPHPASARVPTASTAQSGSVAQDTGQTLTNGDVIKMVQAHLGADIIVEQIRSNPGNFSLSTSSLIKLKQAGVPEKIIIAMQAKRSPSPETGSDGARGDAITKRSDENRPAVPENEQNIPWQTRQSKDSMTDQVKTYAITTVGGNPRGRFEVTGFCEDASQIDFFFASKSKGLVLKRAPVEQVMTTTGTYGGGQQGSVSAPQSCVHMRVRIGSREVQDYNSTFCDNDQYASLTFLGDRTKAMRESLHAVGKGFSALSAGSDPRMNQAMGEIGKMLSGVFLEAGNQSLDAMGAMGMVRMNDVLAADSMRVELPFTDGSTSVVAVDLQDPVFHQYASQCQIGNSMTTAQGHATAGNYAAAIEEYNQILKVQPYNQDAKRGLADVQAAQRQRQIAQLMTTAQENYSQGKFAAAIDSYHRVIDIDHGNLEATSGLANAQAAQQRQVEVIRQLGGAAVWLDPSTQLIWTVKKSEHTLNWDEANDYCQTLTLGGSPGWRLPTLQEINRMDDLGRRAPNHIGPIIAVSHSDYIWSSTVPPDRRDLAEAVSLGYAYRGVFRSTRENMRAVCVTTGQTDGANVAPSANSMHRADLPKPNPSPEPPIVQTVAEATWVDQHTGLMWTKRDSGKNMNSADAGAYCSSLRIGNFTDWRLPTPGELKTVYDKSVIAKTPRALEYYANRNIQLTAVIVWANSKKKDDPVMMYFGTGDGTGRLVSHEIQMLDQYASALCVRKN